MINKTNFFQELQKLDNILELNFKQELDIKKSLNVKIFPMKLVKLSTCIGVYFICSNTEILYIGKSIQLGVRVAGHCTESSTQVPSDEIKQIFYIPVSIQDLDGTEKACIYFFHPKYNNRPLNWNQKMWISRLKKWIKDRKRYQSCYSEGRGE